MFGALLLIGGNVGVSSENSNSSSDKIYFKKSKSVNPRKYSRGDYKLDTHYLLSTNVRDKNEIGELNKNVIFGAEDNDFSHSVSEINIRKQNMMLDDAHDDEYENLGKEYDDSDL